MTDQISKAEAFKALHIKGTPLVLWNIWDAGSAKAVADTGARAIATGSWSVAAAQGYGDGEALPMEAALQVARQIVSAVDVPVSVDFEGGYAVGPDDVGQNAARLIETGAVGLNFEDRVVGGEGLHPMEDQVARIVAIRKAAQAVGVPFFINARTDVFFCGDDAPASELLAKALTRAEAYREAGADGLFVPGLTEPELIAQICDGQALPVNIMRMGDGLQIAALAQAGVSRISHGPAPYLSAMKALGKAAIV